MLGAAEVEGEGVVGARRAEPDVAVGARLEVGIEVRGVVAAHERVHAVGGDDEVGVVELRLARDLGLVAEHDAQLLAAALQDGEEPLAPDADEAHGAAVDPHLDVVPVVERLLDGVGGRRIAAAHARHGGVGEDDAPAERVVWAIALDDGDVVRGERPLHEQGEVEARGTAADADDAHGAPVAAGGAHGGWRPAAGPAKVAALPARRIGHRAFGAWPWARRHGRAPRRLVAARGGA
ncbi:MAG: hypothetical protein MUF21_04070 [Gemmatimonadaceae bacterium]|nr:hypothetical protein [Gemmatimonadaceae bacterium]